jgi:hypothetical protein
MLDSDKRFGLVDIEAGGKYYTAVGRKVKPPVPSSPPPMQLLSAAFI